MPDTTNPQGDVEETPASETPEKVAEPLNPRASIYEKYDAQKAAREAAENPPAEDAEPESPPDKEASEPEKQPEAEPAKEPAVEELTPEEFAERFKNVKVKGKFAGEEAVVDAKDLLRLKGVDRHYTKSLQELAREREALRAQAAGIQPSQPAYEPPTPPTGQEKALRYWNENEVEQRYNDLVLESPYRANQFLETVKTERQRAQEESNKARMDNAERDFFALHPDMEPHIKDYFGDPKAFSDPAVSAAFERGDYYGALEIANVRIEAKRLAEERKAISAAREAETAEARKKADLKKKGAVIRSSTKPEVQPIEEFKPLSPAEVIAQEAARRRRFQNR